MDVADAGKRGSRPSIIRLASLVLRLRWHCVPIDIMVVAGISKPAMSAADNRRVLGISGSLVCWSPRPACLWSAPRPGLTPSRCS
jgi:hypothetical protein